MNTTQLTPASGGRYVCHFLDVLTETERTSFGQYGIDSVNRMYSYAIKKANKVGGRKYHCRAYGGGIAFYGSAEQVATKIAGLTA